MAEKILSTKIALLYKTYAQWDAIKTTYVPLKGEVCFCEVPASTGVSLTEPCVLFKVGDGTKNFETLPWSSALAADVFAWAKKEHLEWADFTDTLREEIKQYVGGGPSGGNTVYRIIADGDYKWKLQKKDESSPETAWIDAVGVIDLSTTISAITTSLANKLDVMPGDVHSYGNPYNLPYYFYTSATGEKVTVTAKTVTLDGRKTQGEYSLDVDTATQSLAGLLSASDKAKLDHFYAKDLTQESDDILILKCSV